MADEHAGQAETSKDVTSFSDFGREAWSFLTSKRATIDYTFIDMIVEVPRQTGADSPRAVWRLDGTLRITTSDEDSRGSAT